MLRQQSTVTHSVQKSSFFLEFPISGKAYLHWLAKTFLKGNCLWGNLNTYLLLHYFLYFKRSLCRAQTMLWFLCHDQKKMHFALISFHSLSPGSYVSTQRSCLKRFLKSIIIVLLNVFVALSIIIMQAL